MGNITASNLKTIVQSVLASARRYKPNLSVTDPDDPRFVAGAEGLVNKVSKAQTTAESAQTTAKSAQTTAKNAQSTAKSAQSTAKNAQSTAENAQSTAENAQSTAKNAQSTAETAKKNFAEYGVYNASLALEISSNTTNITTILEGDYSFFADADVYVIPTYSGAVNGNVTKTISAQYTEIEYRTGTGMPAMRLWITGSDNVMVAPNIVAKKQGIWAQTVGAAYTFTVRLERKSPVAVEDTTARETATTAQASATAASEAAAEAKATAAEAKAAAEGKMGAENPTGTGALSIGRAEGTTIGGNSSAVGNEVEASGVMSHAEGWATTASGVMSHAEGWATTASGGCAHAEGQDTTAKGNRSHAEGEGTIANGDGQHVQGKYNVEDTEGKYAHIVGNGTDYDDSSNAHTLDWDGNAWFAGAVEGTSLIANANDKTVKLYANKEGALVAEDADGTLHSVVLDDALNDAITTALQNAKDSGDFKGDKGDKGDTGATGANGKDGTTPVKGTDYWTEADKQEIIDAVVAALENTALDSLLFNDSITEGTKYRLCITNGALNAIADSDNPSSGYEPVSL